MGTLGADGSGGSFHLRPTAQPWSSEERSKGPGDPKWLAGQWARLHDEWMSMPILRLRGTPKLEDDNVIHELNWIDQTEADRSLLRFRVHFGDIDSVSIGEGFETFWSLAPGEVHRYGGPDSDGFVVSIYDHKQTLELDDPLPFCLAAVEVCKEQTEETVAARSADKAKVSVSEKSLQPFLLPLRTGPPSLFPHAIVGPWLRAGSLIEVYSDFSCREDETDFQMQVFPETWVCLKTVLSPTFSHYKCPTFFFLVCFQVSS